VFGGALAVRNPSIFEGMHELDGLGHSMTHAVVGLCRDETRTSEHIGSPAEGGWTVANDNEMYLVAAFTCNILQHWLRGRVSTVMFPPCAECLQMQWFL
jgi:hypothetical protein